MNDLLTAWHQTAAYQPDDARRRLQQRVRAAWREERQRGAYNPANELALDLDALTDDELVALRNLVRERISWRDDMGSTGGVDLKSGSTASHGQDATTDPFADLPALPDGWRWIERYRAEHPTYGRTATYNDVRLALRDVRKRMPKVEKADGPAERVQGELFP